MKIRYVLLMLAVGAVLPLAGCSTEQGGTANQYNTTAGAGVGEAYPEPAGSPTFRPGMNPRDPRDAHFTIRPQPTLSPSPTAGPS